MTYLPAPFVVYLGLLPPINTMKPNLSLKFLEGVTEKLKEENSDLKKEVESLREIVGSLQNELQALSIVVSENIERREAVETGLVAIEQSCSDLQDKQKKMSSAIELQAQYSRKNTLLLAGKAIPGFQDGENTRMTVVSLLKEYLGLDIHPRAITACHRLRNKSIILVRFADLDERMTVYSQRLSPKKRGLLIHESLTNERLAVIHTLQKLHKSRETSPFLSYYTSMGRIFIRLADPTGRKAAKTVELAVGVTEKGILEICEHHKVKKTASSKPTSSKGNEKSQKSNLGGARGGHIQSQGQIHARVQDTPAQTAHSDPEPKPSPVSTSVPPAAPQPPPVPPVVDLPQDKSEAEVGGAGADRASGGDNSNLPSSCILPTSSPPVPPGSDVLHSSVTTTPSARADDPDHVLRGTPPAEKPSHAEK